VIPGGVINACLELGVRVLVTAAAAVWQVLVCFLFCACLVSFLCFHSHKIWCQCGLLKK